MAIRSQITDKQREQMFKAYLEKQSMHYVYKKTGISKSTIKRYKNIDQWDKRINMILEKQWEQEAASIAKIRLENLSLVRELKDQLIQKAKANEIDFNKIDVAIDKLIRLELLLLGEADSKQDVNLGNIVVEFGDIDNDPDSTVDYRKDERRRRKERTEKQHNNQNAATTQE